jgi:hypothetical protein
MPGKEPKRDLPEVLLNLFASRVPDESSEWAGAMLAELEALPDPKERMGWAISASLGLVKIWFEGWLRRIFFDPLKPLPVILIAAYHAIFCCVLLGVIVNQLPHLRSSWTDAAFPILFMAFAAIIPGVIALGLWILDDSARYLAIVFSLLHGLGNYALLSTGRLPWTARPLGRIGLDVLIIGILMLPSIGNAFRPPPIHLSLNS